MGRHIVPDAVILDRQRQGIVGERRQRAGSGRLVLDKHISAEW